MKESNAKIIAFSGDQQSLEQIKAGLIRGEACSAVAFYDRFGDLINRMVWRLLGADSEHDDVVQNVFSNVLSSIHKLRDSQAMGEWIIGVTVHTVRREIRSRRYRRLLFAPFEFKEEPAENGRVDSELFHHRFYNVIRKLDTDLQVIFVLRYVEKMTLKEITDALRSSSSTTKRRLAQAKKQFYKHAARDFFLASMIEETGDDG